MLMDVKRGRGPEGCRENKKMEITKEKFDKLFANWQRSSKFYFWHKLYSFLWTKLEGEFLDVNINTEVLQSGQSSSMSYDGLVGNWDKESDPHRRESTRFTLSS